MIRFVRCINVHACWRSWCMCWIQCRCKDPLLDVTNKRNEECRECESGLRRRNVNCWRPSTRRCCSSLWRMCLWRMCVCVCERQWILERAREGQGARRLQEASREAAVWRGLEGISGVDHAGRSATVSMSLRTWYTPAVDWLAWIHRSWRAANPCTRRLCQQHGSVDRQRWRAANTGTDRHADLAPFSIRLLTCALRPLTGSVWKSSEKNRLFIWSMAWRRPLNAGVLSTLSDLPSPRFKQYNFLLHVLKFLCTSLSRMLRHRNNAWAHCIYPLVLKFLTHYWQGHA